MRNLKFIEENVMLYRHIFERLRLSIFESREGFSGKIIVGVHMNNSDIILLL